MAGELIIDETAPVRDSLLYVAEAICMREARSVDEFGRKIVEWIPGEAAFFPEPIELRSIVLSENFDPKRVKIFSVQMCIGGDNDTMFKVSREDDLDAFEDSFSRAFLEDFKKSYDAHSHASCFRALRQAAIAKRDRERNRERVQASASKKTSLVRLRSASSGEILC